jgi:hypothetical protein
MEIRSQSCRYKEKLSHIFIFAGTGADNILKFMNNGVVPMKKKGMALLDNDDKGREVAKGLGKNQVIYVSKKEGEIERLFDDELLIENNVLVDGKITKLEEKKRFAAKMKSLPNYENKKQIFKNFELQLRVSLARQHQLGNKLAFETTK